MATLVLIRHGQSQWNLENRFTGWVDVPLSIQGREEARKAGQKLATYSFDLAFNSNLIRATETLLLVMEQNKIGKTLVFTHSSGKLKSWARHSSESAKELPVISSDALNERCYGALQGLNKTETAKKYGEEKVHIWRRSYSVRPPRGESLSDTAKRTIPYFTKSILPYLKKGKNVVISAHGNSLRSLVMYLDHLSHEEVVQLELATGVPLIYEIDKNGRVIDKKTLL